MINLIFLQSVSGRKASTSMEMRPKRILAPRGQSVRNRLCSPHNTAFRNLATRTKMTSPPLTPFSPGMPGNFGQIEDDATERWVFWVWIWACWGGVVGRCVGGGARLHPVCKFPDRSRETFKWGVSGGFGSVRSGNSLLLFGCTGLELWLEYGTCGTHCQRTARFWPPA